MKAWNVYASTLLSAKPSRALELFGYQRLITSANIQLPFSAWMTYDVKFRTLAANNPLLRWDAHHPDLWLECLTISNQQLPSAGLAPTAIVYTTSLITVPFVVANLQFHQLMTDSHSAWDAHPLPAQPLSQQTPPANSQTHHPTFVETLTTEESVHDHIVPFITIANAVEGPIQGSSVPTPRDSHSPSTEGRGPRTPL